MKEIRIETGTVEVPVYCDNVQKEPLRLNLEDVAFINRYYSLCETLDKKEKQYRLKIKTIEADKTVDKYGISKSTVKLFKLAEETFDEMAIEFDKVFGEGTTNNLFGKSKNPLMFIKFIDQLGAIIDESRSSKINKYVNEESEGNDDVME